MYEAFDKINREIPVTVGGTMFSWLWPTGYQQAFKNIHTLLLHLQCFQSTTVCGRITEGVYLGAGKCWFKRYRAITCSSSPACCNSQAVSRLSGLVEGGARELKSLLIFTVVDPKTHCVRSVLCSLSLLGGWSQLISSTAGWVPEEPCLRHPDCTLKGAAWPLLKCQPVLCPGWWVFIPMRALKEPAAVAGERERLSPHATQAFLFDQELSSCMGKPIELMDQAGYPKAGFQGKVNLKFLN